MDNIIPMLKFFWREGLGENLFVHKKVLPQGLNSFMHVTAGEGGMD